MSEVLQVLVLERDEERRRTLAEALRGAGLTVFETADAQSAAESLEAGGFDAAVVSLAWPELDPTGFQAAVCPTAPESPVSLDAAERTHIARMLAHTGGNRRQAALLLGISRSTLLHKIRKYGLDHVRGRKQRRTYGEG